ncbi:MAG: Glutathione transport system permease protein GsiC [Anaerolineales bacterium]|nr:Glutathione transport system permease protein GsiC [Anaerolineales bacterium]
MRRGVLLYLGSRLLQSVLVLWVVVTILFLLFRLAPGNPLVAYIDPTFTEEQQQTLMRQFGLDQPLHIQYVVYLRNLLRGEMGDSFFQRAPVGELVMQVLPNTLYLTLTSLLVAYVIGVIGGVVLAWQRGTRWEQAGVTFTLMTRAAPQFWVGMIFLMYFAFRLQWLPSSGATSAGVIFDSEWAKLTSLDFWKHMVLPATTLALYLHGLPLLLMRSNMLEVMEDDFITMGRLIGYSEWRLMIRHAARNALLPVVTAMALGIGYSIGGNVVIETVFGWPGLGRQLVRAVSASDYPLAQGAFFLIALVMVLMNFVADLLYGFLDPRVGSSERAGA